jgi:hypothetical protein
MRVAVAVLVVQKLLESKQEKAPEITEQASHNQHRPSNTKVTNERLKATTADDEVNKAAGAPFQRSIDGDETKPDPPIPSHAAQQSVDSENQSTLPMLCSEAKENRTTRTSAAANEDLGRRPCKSHGTKSKEN